MMKVYVQRPDQFFYYTVKMTADFCNSPIQTVLVDETMAQDKAFQAKKAHGSFPILELANGTMLYESSAIAAHIARSAGNTDFLGGSDFGQAQVSSVVDFANSSIAPCMAKIAYHTFGIADDKAGYAKASADIKQHVKLLNEKL